MARRLLLDKAGAAWWPRTRTLIFADLHFEKGSSYARGRQFLPPYDTRTTLLRMAQVVARRSPARIIALGDFFHDPFAAERLGVEERGMLAALPAPFRLDHRQSRSPSAGLAGRRGDAGMAGGRSDFPPRAARRCGAGRGRGPSASGGHGRQIWPRRAAALFCRRCRAAAAAVLRRLYRRAGCWRCRDLGLFGSRFHAFMLGEERVYAIPRSGA